MVQQPLPEGHRPEDEKIEKIQDSIDKAKKIEPKTGREKGMKEGLIQFLETELKRAQQKKVPKDKPDIDMNVPALVHALTDIPLGYPHQKPPETSRKIPVILGGLSIIVLIAIAGGVIKKLSTSEDAIVKHLNEK